MHLGSFRPIFDIVQGVPQNQEVNSRYRLRRPSSFDFASMLVSSSNLLGKGILHAHLTYLRRLRTLELPRRELRRNRVGMLLSRESELPAPSRVCVPSGQYQQRLE
jgi:hypothetical protein